MMPLFFSLGWFFKQSNIRTDCGFVVALLNVTLGMCRHVVVLNTEVFLDLQKHIRCTFQS